MLESVYTICMTKMLWRAIGPEAVASADQFSVYQHVPLLGSRIVRLAVSKPPYSRLSQTRHPIDGLYLDFEERLIRRLSCIGMKKNRRRGIEKIWNRRLKAVTIVALWISHLGA